MQEVSHTTRAFIWNADGLPGFVKEVDFVDILKSYYLGEETKHHAVNFESLYKELKSKTLEE